MKGYIVLWHGTLKPHGTIAMFQSAASGKDRGVLFNPGNGAATLFPTRKQAAGAVRRSKAYWKDGYGATTLYSIVPVNDRGIL